MEFHDIVYKRQSVRKFKEQDVPREDILKIIQDAGRAPSGKNVQNWHFLVIKRRDIMEKIAQTLVDKNEEIAGKMDEIDVEKGLRFRKFAKNFTLFFLKAPVLVVVYTTYYYPSGFHELTLINAPKEVTDDILLKRNPGMQSLGAALENFTLSAIDHGYGTCWLTSLNYAAKEIENLLKEELNFEKEGYFLGAMMSLGVPEDDLKSPKKKELQDIYTFVE